MACHQPYEQQRAIRPKCLSLSAYCQLLTVTELPACTPNCSCLAATRHFSSQSPNRRLAPNDRRYWSSKRGSELFAFGVMEMAEALTNATELAQAVLAAQPS